MTVSSQSASTIDALLNANIVQRSILVKGILCTATSRRAHFFCASFSGVRMRALGQEDRRVT